MMGILNKFSSSISSIIVYLGHRLHGVPVSPLMMGILNKFSSTSSSIIVYLGNRLRGFLGLA